ncbi:MAG: HAD family hydrolase [Oscillospiraceae bacterium]|nr:HAD family hydrolase [Oscillospiraceae bacterium]
MECYQGIYLYTDLDGTLLDDEKNVSDTNLQAIRRLLDGGGHFGIATGRPLYHLDRQLERLPVDAPCILCNGAAIYDFGAARYLARFPLPKRAALDVICQMRALLPEISIQIFCEAAIFEVNPQQDDTLFEIWDNLPRVRIAPELVTQPWHKIIFCHHGAVLDRTVPKLRIPEGLIAYRSEETYFELLAVSKGGALAQLRQALPDMRTLLTIGDYENDLDLVRCGDIGAAPRNAIANVLAAADLTVKDNNQNAIADLLERTVFSNHFGKDENYELPKL